ncbi:MAG: ATP-binding protein [Bacteroidales bacterium]|nr:ATP-binding protein [Bacteroidales bacterium]
MKQFDISQLIGEATEYDNKQALEERRPKSWCKSVSAFANGIGGKLVWGIADDDTLVGLADAKGDAEKISEAIKAHIDPTPDFNLSFAKCEDKEFVVLDVMPGKQTPYYYIGDGQMQAFVRVGNESVVASTSKHKELVLKGPNMSFDSLESRWRFEDMAFSKLKSVHYKRLQRSFEDSEFTSWGIIDENGKLTNAGALLADESPVRQSRIFCTRWNGLDMTSGLGEAIDDVELEGCVIGQLQDAVSFVRNNSKKKWWKENDYREELPDYPERAVTEAIANAIIHRDYMQMGSEIHIDMYDDRLEIYSPGGMMDGSLIQQLNPLSVPSKRRNPLLADFFSRLGLMERRGSGMKKIINTYRRYEQLSGCHAPEFTSNASEFHVTLWNLNYDGSNNNTTTAKASQEVEFIKEPVEFTKEFIKEPVEFTKEFIKASRQIYKLISMNSKVSTIQMADSMGLSTRQVLKYLKRLQELGKITRVGGRKMGEWKIIDEEYEGFFDRI